MRFGIRWFGIVGAIGGTVGGGCIGFVIGSIPTILVDEWMFRAMRNRSNAELKELIEKGEGSKGQWKFLQTLALLNLQLRGEDVQAYLPRVLTLMESDDPETRLFGRDALRWGFTELAVQINDYNPQAFTEECRRKVAILRAGKPIEIPGAPSPTSEDRSSRAE